VDVSAINTDECTLTIKQLRFVNEYMIDSNGTQAAIRAGYSEQSASVQAYDLLRRPHIIKAIEERLRAAATAAGISAETVINELYDLAFADASELQELNVRPCPKCWPAGLTLEDPNPLCDSPSIAEGFNFGGCAGAGIAIVKLTPTRKLSRRTAKLISAIRQKKDGSIEIEMRSQDKALELLGRARCVFVDRKELSGPGGSPVALMGVPARELTDEQIMARLALSEAPRALPEGTIEGSLVEPLSNSIDPNEL
jgi:hypothetical protein